MTVYVPQNQEIAGGKKSGVGRGLGSALRQKRANRWSMSIKEQ